MLKRIYEPYKKSDGFRVLVDRLWPRGLSKERAKIDRWFKDIAPTTELRKWFGHEPEKWSKFRRKYMKELDDKKEMVKELRELHTKHPALTLLYAARDEKHNEAIVIREVVKK